MWRSMHMSSTSISIRQAESPQRKSRWNLANSTEEQDAPFVGALLTYFTTLSAHANSTNTPTWQIEGLTPPDASGQFEVTEYSIGEPSRVPNLRTCMFTRRSDDTAVLINRIDWPKGPIVQWPLEAQQRLACFVMLSYLPNEAVAETHQELRSIYSWWHGRNLHQRPKPEHHVYIAGGNANPREIPPLTIEDDE